MGKTLKYGDFKFDSGFGFTGSAGKQMVKGYARGGGVKKYAEGDYVDADSQIRKIINDDADDAAKNAPTFPKKPPMPPKRPADLGREQSPEYKPHYDGEPVPKKKGGMAKHDDAKQDKALVKSMVKPMALKARGGMMGKKRGVPVAPKAPMIAPQGMQPQMSPMPGGLKMGGKASKNC